MMIIWSYDHEERPVPDRSSGSEYDQGANRREAAALGWFPSKFLGDFYDVEMRYFSIFETDTHTHMAPADHRLWICKILWRGPGRMILISDIGSEAIKTWASTWHQDGWQWTWHGWESVDNQSSNFRGLQFLKTKVGAPATYTVRHFHSRYFRFLPLVSLDSFNLWAKAIFCFPSNSCREVHWGRACVGCVLIPLP